MGNQAEVKEITAEELVAVLKFTPRTYKISMWGYGGEKVMGTVSRESYDYCMDNQVDLSDIAWNSDACEEMGLDADLLPFSPGSWYECDGITHVNGVSRGAGTLQIEDENGDTVLERALEDFDGGDGSAQLNTDEEAWIGQGPAGTVVFVGSSNEKGTFFEGEIQLTQPFDIEKLELLIAEVDGEEIVHGVTYNGEDIDNWGSCTDGKSSDFGMYVVIDSNTWETYSPEEKDWGHPEYGTSPESWEQSVNFKFKTHKPVYPGYYNAVWSNFGTTYGSLYWDGKEFGEWEHGKFKPESNVITWSGYNWDTSSWDNRLAAPPDIICDNKKCGWVGLGEERREDEDYNSHCPECDGTEFSWIDYDPNTAKGRKNREKYCQPTRAEFLTMLDNALIELAEEAGMDFEK